MLFSIFLNIYLNHYANLNIVVQTTASTSSLYIFKIYFSQNYWL